MKIYTKTGDSGETGLFAGPRVRKDDLRIEAYGTVDELNAVLGLARSAAATSSAQHKLPSEIDSLLATIQHTLFDLGSQLATPDPKARGTNFVTTRQIETLEQAIDRFESQLPPLKNFILPGGAPAAAWLHLARTVCRRAERRVVTLMHRKQKNVLPEALIYLNRLSDLLFVLARAANQSAGQADVPWEKSG
jgi:cob(I)alamin adenosyltransferase